MSISIDLTTLSGYASLEPGTYTIKAKAKGSGIYTPSNLSTGVSYTKTIPMPTKGQIINLDMDGDGTNEQYRVIKLLGNDIVEVFAMTNTSSVVFGSFAAYENNALDTCLNSTLYSTFSSTAKTAIVDKTFSTGPKWIGQFTGNPVYKGITSNNTEYYISVSDTTYGTTITRHVYPLKYEDVLEYLDVPAGTTPESTTLTANNLNMMFWNDTSVHSDYLWLCNIVNDGDAGSVGGSNGWLTGYNSSASLPSRAAFQIDLSKIQWS